MTDSNTSSGKFMLETLLVERIFAETDSKNQFFTSDIEFNPASLQVIIKKYFDRYMPNVNVATIEFVGDFDSLKHISIILEPKRDIQTITPGEETPENQVLATQVRFQAKRLFSITDLENIITLHVLETMPEVEVLKITPVIPSTSRVLHIFKKIELERIIVQIATHK